MSREFQKTILMPFLNCFSLRNIKSTSLVLSGALAIAAGLWLASGCERSEPPPAPPLPAVTVSHPLVREVIEWDEYTGHLEAPEVVTVSARVSGFLEQASFKEGTIVHKGDVLFVIDPRPFQADLDSKEADVAKDEAQAALTGVQFRRYEQLRQSKSVSEQDYDNVKASNQQAEAVLAGARAAAALARLNLEWTRVTAPITGRISRKYVTEGNLVNGGAGQATLLTTIESVDPIYCYVDVPETAVLKYQQLSREKKRATAREARVPAFMSLADETSFAHEGVIDFVDNKIDVGTGTISARGVFPNPQGSLTPGFFARMRVPGSGRYQALLIPDSAISTDQNIKYLLVVGPDDIVKLRPVKIGALFDGLRSIEEGISSSDMVIVNGIQRARPDTKVAPTEVPISQAAFKLTAPAGSPATQDLPAVRELPATAPAEPATRAE